MNNTFNRDPGPSAQSFDSQKQGFFFWWHVLSSWFIDVMKSPVVATATLFMSGALFAIIVMISYPDSQTPSGTLPVVSADEAPFKYAADEAGQADIPHQDSTVFQVMRDEGRGEIPVIENLLTPPTDTQETQEAADSADQEKEDTPDQDAQQVAQTADTQPPAAITPLPPEPAAETKQDSPAAAPTDTVRAPHKKPKIIHPAGSSPETIEYVRSILDQNADAPKPATQATQGDQPLSITPGNTYVQLGSVKQESGAVKEWQALQKTFPDLKNSAYRIQRADLGAKGTFFRIQAGPMNAQSANALCARIKRKKPGGCLVVR